jgi:hypothetical protein
VIHATDFDFWAELRIVVQIEIMPWMSSFIWVWRRFVMCRGVYVLDDALDSRLLVEKLQCQMEVEI